MRNLVQEVLGISAVLLLVGAVSLAQARSVQSAADRVGPVEAPVAPTPSGTRVQAAKPGSQPSGNSPAQTGAGISNAAPAAPSSEMFIRPGDLLQVSVFGAPDYVQQVRVGADGEVMLPPAGVNLIELLMRLNIACLSRLWSA